MRHVVFSPQMDTGPTDIPAPGPKGRSLARAVLGGTALLTIAGIVTRMFGLASSPILTRLVGPAPYGVVALAGTISSLATTVALLGVDLAYFRFFFIGGDSGRSVERFCWRFSLSMGLGFSLVAGAGWWLISPSSLYSGLAPVVAAGTLVALIVTMSTTRRRIHGDYPRIAAATVAGGAVGVVVSVFLAWRWRADAQAMLVGALIGSLATVAILGIPPVSSLLRPSGLGPAKRKELLLMGIAGAVTAPMYWVIASADRWFLGAWAGAGSLGIYSFASTIGLIGMMVNSALTLAWFPEVSREYEASPGGSPAAIGRMWARLAALLMVTWLAVAASGGDLIRLFADRRFHEGAAFVPWIAGGVFFNGMASLANTGLLLSRNLVPTAWCWTAGAAANLALNALLVGPFGAMGASLASFLSYALIAAGMVRAAQCRLYLPIPWGKLAGAAALAIGAGALMSFPWSASPAWSLMMKLPAGAAAAAAMGAIAAPDWMRSFARGDLFRREAP